MYVDIPVNTELAAPLTENCIWRQVRGSGAEVSGSDGPVTTTEKVKTCSLFFFSVFASCFFLVVNCKPVVSKGLIPRANEQCHQVGIAQQWYDELDNLAFSEVAEEPTTAHGDVSKPGDQNYQDQRRVQFTCAVNVSPGTCEVP